jgi:hypothetical protein
MIMTCGQALEQLAEVIKTMPPEQILGTKEIFMQATERTKTEIKRLQFERMVRQDTERNRIYRGAEYFDTQPGASDACD